MGDAGSSRAMGLFISIAVLKTGSPSCIFLALVLILDGGLWLDFPAPFPENKFLPGEDSP